MMRSRAFFVGGACVAGLGLAAVATSCSATDSGSNFASSGTHGGTGGEAGTKGGGDAATDGGGGGNDGSLLGDGSLFDSNIEACTPHCSVDQTQVVDCFGKVVETCGAGELCTTQGCATACDAAKQNKSSIGCEYYATMLDGYSGAEDGCFVAFVANTFAQPAHLTVTLDGTPVDLATHAKIPQGSGQSLSYGPYDATAGLPPSQVAILFLGGGTNGGVTCPVPSAYPNASSSGIQVNGTGRGKSFRIETDVPVVAYQMLPYGGGSAAVTGATLLLPTSAWDTNYIAADAYVASTAAGTSPSMTLVASEDGTNVTILPKVAIQAGSGVQGGSANVPVTYTLSAGQTLQFSQQAELTGSPIQSDKPIGLFAGHQCLNVPSSTAYCDHAEQQIPPVRALGSEYVGVSYRQRSSAPENPPWRIVGAVDGTQLTFDPPVGGPSSVNLGDVAEFTTSTPFVVESQDDQHPFLLVTYMTGSTSVQDGYGDADFVRITAAAQYLNRYVFFTDPTYPETDLVVVRKKGQNGFDDVMLDCGGTLSGWQPVGSSGQYEYTRRDLVSGNFQPQAGCDNGRHEMTSPGTFGLWVWGWGTPLTSSFTANVSYGYPAGENVQAINTVVVPPTPH